VASLKPKLFCGVAFGERAESFSRALLAAVFGCNLREHLRHNRCQTAELSYILSQPGNASAPTEPVSALHSENQTGVRNGKLYEQLAGDVKRRTPEKRRAFSLV